MKKNVTYITLLLLISVMAFVLIKNFISGRTNIRTTYEQLGYKENYDHTNPRQVCDYFSVNLIHEPEKAYQLFSKCNEGLSLKQFIKSRNVSLPASKYITSIEFAKVEHGFTNMPSGLQSSEYTYKVKSTDDFQPNITLEIDVVEKENIYHVLRYGVISK